MMDGSCSKFHEDQGSITILKSYVKKFEIQGERVLEGKMNSRSRIVILTNSVRVCYLYEVLITMLIPLRLG